MTYNDKKLKQKKGKRKRKRKKNRHKYVILKNCNIQLMLFFKI